MRITGWEILAIGLAAIVNPIPTQAQEPDVLALLRTLGTTKGITDEHIASCHKALIKADGTKIPEPLLVRALMVDWADLFDSREYLDFNSTGRKDAPRSVLTNLHAGAVSVAPNVGPKDSALFVALAWHSVNNKNSRVKDPATKLLKDAGLTDERIRELAQIPKTMKVASQNMVNAFKDKKADELSKLIDPEAAKRTGSADAVTAAFRKTWDAHTKSGNNMHFEVSRIYTLFSTKDVIGGIVICTYNVRYKKNKFVSEGEKYWVAVSRDKGTSWTFFPYTTEAMLRSIIPGIHDEFHPLTRGTKGTGPFKGFGK